MSRPCFKINGKPYVSAGTIIYSFLDGEHQVLLQRIHGKPRLEDFGGKSDKTDKCIRDTAFRECQEETNNILTKKKLSELFKSKKSFVYYVYNSKYVVYYIWMEPNEATVLKSALFGDQETHDGIKRTVEWIPLKSLSKNSVHIRLHEIVEDMKSVSN